MKKFEVEWETCYCDDFPEKWGTTIIEAETPDEAKKKFYEKTKAKIMALVMKVTERSI